MPEPAIVTAAKAARARLLAGEREAVAPLLDSYTRLYQRTAADLKALLAQIAQEVAAGATPGPARLFERDRLQKIVAQVAGELQRLGAQVAEITTARQSELIGQAQSDARELTNAAMTPRPRGFDGPTWLHVPTEQLEHLVGIAGDGSPLKTLLSGLAPDGAKQFRETLLQGVALGLDEREIASDVRDIFGGNMSRALRVVRTEEMRSYRESTRLGFEANSHVLSGMEWFASLSRDTCPACLGNHGKIFPVDYVMESHPNCRCLLVPQTKTWEELGFPAGVEPPPPPESGFPETGPEWFARQPAEKQREILGAGGFAAYQKGEVTLADFVGHKHDPEWGGMYQTRSLKQIKAGVNRDPAPMVSRQKEIHDMLLTSDYKVKDLSPDQMKRMARLVSESGWDLREPEKVKPLVYGLRDSANRLLGPGDTLPTDEHHFLRHVVAQKEWPEGTTLEGYLDDVRKIVNDPNSGVIVSQVGTRWHIAFVVKSGEMRGPDGHEFVMVEYRMVNGHVMTAMQPKEGLEHFNKRLNRKWLRYPQ